MKAHVQLINKDTGEIRKQDVFLGSIPLMTDSGTFIVGGIERVVVSQLVRSPGVFFSTMPDFPSTTLPKSFQSAGVWMEIETDRRGIITCKIDRKRKIPITQLLRVFGCRHGRRYPRSLQGHGNADKDYIAATRERHSPFCRRGLPEHLPQVRPGDLATAENAKI